jgi:hypothetical protein
MKYFLFQNLFVINHLIFNFYLFLEIVIIFLHNSSQVYIYAYFIINGCYNINLEVILFYGYFYIILNSISCYIRLNFLYL